MKNDRQRKILEIIEKYDVDTQETLIKKLGEAGFVVTQTTVSRDIKQLKLVKGTTGMGTYKYVTPKPKKEDAQPTIPTSSIVEAVVGVEAAQNIVVVKTFAGMANAAAVCIESLSLTRIVGAVAGDDTVLIVVSDNDSAKRLESELKGAFGI